MDNSHLIGAQSMGMIGKSFLQDDLIDLTSKMKKKVVKKTIASKNTAEASGLDKFLCDDSDSDGSSSDDSFEE